MWIHQDDSGYGRIEKLEGVGGVVVWGRHNSDAKPKKILLFIHRREMCGGWWGWERNGDICGLGCGFGRGGTSGIHGVVGSP